MRASSRASARAVCAAPLLSPNRCAAYGGCKARSAAHTSSRFFRARAEKPVQMMIDTGA